MYSNALSRSSGEELHKNSKIKGNIWESIIADTTPATQLKGKLAVSLLSEHRSLHISRDKNVHVNIILLSELFFHSALK